mgnify:FL=1
MKLQFAPICREHNRQDFDCSEPEMNDYIHSRTQIAVSRLSIRKSQTVKIPST